MVTNEQSRQSEQSFPRYMNQEPNSTTLQILLKRTSLLECSMRVLVLARLNMRRACYMDDFLEVRVGGNFTCTMQEQNCRCKLQQFWGVLRKRFRVGRPHMRVFLAKNRTNGSYFGHMASSYLTLEMGASCTCKTQVQCKLRQFWGSCASPPPLS